MTALDTPGGRVSRPAQSEAGTIRSVSDVLAVARRHDAATLRSAWRSPIPLGFDLIDRVLEGGLRPHDLVLLGGAPGVGKTVAALQMARHSARNGRPAVYVSYEHSEMTMLGRLLVLELGELSHARIAPDVDRLRARVIAALEGFESLESLIALEPLVARAADEVQSYADNLWLVRGSGAHTDVSALEHLLDGPAFERDGVLVVDYLQKVAVHPEPADEAEKVTRVVESLKDLALRRDICILSLVAADWDGLGGGRVRLHHLRGSSALAYECDVAIMMNDKHRAVSRVHLAYDPVKAEKFHHQVVFSIEKNRGGPTMVDVEYRKDFLHFRFEAEGTFLREKLVDDRLAGDV